MISVLAAAGTLDVTRLRVGVGAVPDEKGIVSWPELLPRSASFLI
ncbi:hypothetical protein MASR2M79_18060 [Aminivibrio sp.]